MEAIRAAVQQTNARQTGRQAIRLLRDVARRRGYGTVEAMNDDSFHAEVLSAFDEAIATAKRLGP
jgi:hypothetical protein